VVEQGLTGTHAAMIVEVTRRVERALARPGPKALGARSGGCGACPPSDDQPPQRWRPVMTAAVPNTLWRNKSFRYYADYALTLSFKGDWPSWSPLASCGHARFSRPAPRRRRPA